MRNDVFEVRGVKNSPLVQNLNGERRGKALLGSDFVLARMLLKGLCKKGTTGRKMDSIKQMGMVEHIRKRLGMYWPTHDGILDASVWIFFLDQMQRKGQEDGKSER